MQIGQGGQDARRQDDVAVFTGELDKTIHKKAQGGNRVNELVIIQDDGEMFADILENFVGQDDCQSFIFLFDGRHAVKQRQRFRTKAGKTFPQAGNQIGQEALWFLIQNIEGKPADRYFAG